MTYDDFSLDLILDEEKIGSTKQNQAKISEPI